MDAGRLGGRPRLGARRSRNDGSRSDNRQREARLEAASALAVRLGSPTRKSVKSILESGRDLRRIEPLDLELPAHGNVRGPGYYH